MKKCRPVALQPALIPPHVQTTKELQDHAANADTAGFASTATVTVSDAAAAATAPSRDCARAEPALRSPLYMQQAQPFF